MPSPVNASPVDERLRAELSEENARHEDVMDRLVPGDRGEIVAEFNRHMNCVRHILHDWCRRSGQNSRAS